MKNDLKDNCFVEGVRNPIPNVKHKLSDYLYKRGLCVIEKKSIVFKFTGIIYDKGNLIIVFPKGYTLPNDSESLKEHIKILIKSLIRYKNSNKKVDEYEEDLLGGLGNSKSFSAAMWLIRDYIENGIISFSTEKHKLNKGKKINWSRTIKQTHPIVSSGSPFYIDLIKRNNEKNVSNLIRQIHLFTINKCKEMLGWLYEFSLDDEVQQTKSLPSNIEICLNYLNREMNNTFVDRNIELLKNIKEFLQGSEKVNSRSEIVTLATPYFYNIWEYMIFTIFSDEMKYILPKPYWKINNQTKYTKQIPDTIFIKGNISYIIDAKYYNVEQNLPGWPDLVKQFFYANTYRNTLDNKGRIENIFFFPKTLEDCSIKYYGFSGIENNKEFGYIKAYLLDVYKVMILYANYSTGSMKKDFVELNEDVKIR
ncbi:LlaJI family restriction endonuclease [Bacillus sp. CMF21]|nr:LlaJI family restriction endonuclease [Bacillus sp. CMF21]